MRQIYFILFLFTTINLFCQEEEKKLTSNDDLAAKIQNPIASLVSIPFQYNYDFGGDVRSSSTFNIQPVYPFKLNDNVNLITRTIVPIINKPIPIDNRMSGVGNITLSTFLTPAKPGKFVWGVGPAFLFPTVEQGLGFDKFGIAPSIIALDQKNGWTYGVLAQNFFGVAGNSNVDLNLLSAQIFITKNLKKGWYVNTAPLITANWEATSDSTWTIPLGAGLGRLFKLGKLPINGQLGFYNYLEHPGNADYLIKAQIVLLFPK